MQGHWIFAQVYIFLGLKLIRQPVHDAHVEVVTTQVHVTISRLHFKNAIAQFKNRNVERTTAQVVHRDFHVFVFLVEAISKCCSRGLVYDSLYVQAGNLPGFLGSLTFRIVKIRGNGDHGFRHGSAQVIFGRGLHLLQDHGRNFLWRVQTIANAHTHGVVVTPLYLVAYHFHFTSHIIVLLAHEAFDGLYRVFGIGNGLTLGRVAHFAFAFTVVQKAHDRRGRSAAFAVGDYHRFVAFHNGYATVGCS